MLKKVCHMILHNQKAIVLGGTSGIGLAIAKELYNAGATVIVTGRDQQKLNDAISEIGSNASGEVVDGMNEHQLQDFFTRTLDFHHLVICMSGAKGGGMFRELNLKDLREGFDAKFWPQITAAQASLNTIAHDGSITFISAISARTANPGTAGLAAINAAVEAIVPTLAVELKPLRVNAVSPGVIDTPWWQQLPEAQREAMFADYTAKTPVGRIGKPEDIAASVLLLISNTFMTGNIIECDGGLRFVS